MPEPNILITGTPGCGKTTLAGELATKVGMRHIDIGSMALERGLTCGRDEERNCAILDDDKVCDELEDESDINISGGGVICDYHGCDFFPKRYFQLVVVLRTDNTILWGRLEKRGYPEAKIQENVQAEIMEVIAAEARESYDSSVIMEVQHDSPEQMESALETIAGWVQQCRSM
eukprot:m.452125 g.452125  ORF g.452125 m.452125 type:complete len:174 (-) comp20271_c0_seq1:356-877(-)